MTPATEALPNFINNSIIENAESTLHYIYGSNIDTHNAYAYFKYDVDGKYYRVHFNVDLNKTVDLKFVYEPVFSEKIGKKLTYGGKEYTVLSDNGEELELVANYVSTNKVPIGEKDNYEKTVEDYNSVIEILNNACVTASGLTVGGDVKEIRSIGNSGHTDEEARYLTNPDSSIYTKYDGNLKNTDFFDEVDLIKLYETNALNINLTFWMSTRCIKVESNKLALQVGVYNNIAGRLWGNLGSYTDDAQIGKQMSQAVRPVVVIDANAEGISWID